MNYIRIRYNDGFSIIINKFVEKEKKKIYNYRIRTKINNSIFINQYDIESYY